MLEYIEQIIFSTRLLLGYTDKGHSSSSSSSSSPFFKNANRKARSRRPSVPPGYMHKSTHIYPPRTNAGSHLTKSHHLTRHTDILLHTDPIQQHNIPLRIKPPPLRPGHRTRRDRRRRAMRIDEIIPGRLSRCPYIRVSAHEPIRMAFPSRIRRRVRAIGGC